MKYLIGWIYGFLILDSLSQNQALVKEFHNNFKSLKILQKKLEEKWSLSSDDKDMVVMQHQFIYELNSKLFELHSSFGLIGKNNITTAMSDTVGLPVGIATKLILQNKFTLRGVKRPVYAEIYKPILNELSELGIKFIEEKKDL